MPSSPAPRGGGATTLAPRSWPSRPGFAIRTRIFFAIGPTSIEERLLPDPEDGAHHVADLPERRLRPHGIEDQGHRIVVRLAPCSGAVGRDRALLRVPRPTELPQALDLGLE